MDEYLEKPISEMTFDEAATELACIIEDLQNCLPKKEVTANLRRALVGLPEEYVERINTLFLEGHQKQNEKQIKELKEKKTKLFKRMNTLNKS
ncbi:hypothetical protein [Winogradskyella sp.]|uniref:hypothetical protein n=1 Tax=Winogradskyella sp. TaxID=1883156 RepID=UPI003BAA2987